MSAEVATGRCTWLVTRSLALPECINGPRAFAADAPHQAETRTKHESKRRERRAHALGPSHALLESPLASNASGLLRLSLPSARSIRRC